MKKLYLLKTYFYCLVFFVFLAQIIFLLFLIVEYKHVFLSSASSSASFNEGLESDQTAALFDWTDDFKVISHLMTQNHLNVYLIDGGILKQMQRLGANSTILVERSVPILLAVHYQQVKHYLTKILQEFQNEKFEVVTFFNGNPEQLIPELTSVPIALLLKRTYLFKILLLHARVDNFWWFGSIKSDSEWKRKLSDINASSIKSKLMLHEGALEKFEAVKYDFGSFYSYIPKDSIVFLDEIANSKFIECNHRRAEAFIKKHNIVQAKIQRFQHKVYKILSLTSIVAKQLSVPFWLSSGTCLGYFRQCSVIPYTTDMDIGIFIESYNVKFKEEMVKRGFKLKHQFGFPNDSFELSFVMDSDPTLKLDVFFFYKEKEHYWNGGTQVRTAKKFKYIFPKFHLCWTIFLNLKVRVPCETESYIIANYGSNWMEPVKHWDWKSSPNNVRAAGMWSETQRKEAIQVF